MADSPAPRGRRVVNFADFVARRRAEAGRAAETDVSTTPCLPGFEERERPLNARDVEHRRRMLVHLAGTRG